MVSIVDILVKKDLSRDSIEGIFHKENEEKEFSILFEKMINEINKTDFQENDIIQKNDDYKIEFVVENLDSNDSLNLDKSLKNKSSDSNIKMEDNNIIVKIDKNLDQSVRMNLFLVKMNNFLKENIGSLNFESRSNFLNNQNREKKVEIKVNQLNYKLQNSIKMLIENFRNSKISESDFKFILRKLIDSEIVKELNINGKIKDFRIIKINNENKGKNSELVSKNEVFEHKLVSNFNNLKEKVEDKNLLENKIGIKDKDRIKNNKDNKKMLEQYFSKLKDDVKKGEIKDYNINSINLEKNLNLEVKHSIKSQETISFEQRQELFEHILKNTKILLTNNETKFSTMLRPENLGRMDFHVDIKQGQLNAKIIVHTKEAFDFFRSNVEELRAVFQKSNVEFGKIDISLAGQMDELRESIDFGSSNFNNSSNNFNNNQKSFYDEIIGINSNFYKYEDKYEQNRIEIDSNKSVNYLNSKINLFI